MDDLNARDNKSALEARMQNDPKHKHDWCQKAVEEWQNTYDLAPGDTGFSARYILEIGQRITWLKTRCGKVRSKR